VTLKLRIGGQIIEASSASERRDDTLVDMWRRTALLTKLWLLTLAGALWVCAASAQTVPVLMLSDIHLDPFHDPAKFAQLRTAPATAWAAILDAPASSNQAAEYDRLQSTCGAKGIDTSEALLRSSLAGAQKLQPNPLFVTVSGDLMAHKFDCRFHTLAPTATAAEYSAFAAKTVAYVALQLHLAFPHSPVYFALGNNDSGCVDYREDADSSFLQADALSFAADALNSANSKAIRTEFPQLGDYTINLPSPMQHTRLIVLQDIFQSNRYAACNGTPSAAPAGAQVTWLHDQLAAARAAGQHVWILAHIPPGVDAYSTLSKHGGGGGICNSQSPESFMGSDSLADTLTAFPDVIRLVLLGHTHMDEMRMYKTASGTIPGKLTPSITPVNGNTPSFTLAQIDPSAAILKDYTVFVASNKTGVDATWTPEYTYSTTYHMPDYSQASAAKLAASFLADRNGSSPDARLYQHFFFAGPHDIEIALESAAMQIVWPEYACTMTSAQTASFLSCACPAAAVQ
jgi:sphingomyelin phosphodiesterase acid-like 3